MCGLAGFIDRSGDRSRDRLKLELKHMSDAVSHRGPDDWGEWLDPETGVGFGFRRLSIIDISAAGHQPMESASGRYVIIFNVRDLTKAARFDPDVLNQIDGETRRRIAAAAGLP